MQWSPVVPRRLGHLAWKLCCLFKDFFGATSATLGATAFGLSKLAQVPKHISRKARPKRADTTLPAAPLRAQATEPSHASPPRPSTSNISQLSKLDPITWDSSLRRHTSQSKPSPNGGKPPLGWRPYSSECPQTWLKARAVTHSIHRAPRTCHLYYIEKRPCPAWLGSVGAALT